MTVFGKQAENCEKYLKKGRLVGVQGRIRTGGYTNKDGAKVYTTDVIAQRVRFLSGKNDGGKSTVGEAAEDLPEAPEGGYATLDEDEDIPF